MRTIKTRNNVKNIKILDKSVNLSKRMKDNFIRTKEKAEETQNPRHASPTEYASESIQDKAQGAARETVYHLSNPRQKARDNLNRAKEHFREVKSQMPRERQRAAEQAQKTAHKTKTNAENLRKTADQAGETARDAKTAVKDAKNTLREVRQAGRQTLREVKQGARQESVIRQKTPSDLQRQRGIKRFMRQKTANTAQGASMPTPATGTTKGGMSSPNYLNKGAAAPKNAGDAAKTLQSSAKSTGKAVKSTSKGVKETAKGTIKTAKKSIKTAEQSAKAAVKTAKQTAKTAQRSAKAAAKAAKAAERAAHAAAKTAVKTAKAAARAVAAMVKIAIAAVKGLVAAIAAGGWVVILVILTICMVALLVCSVFGIFFSSERGVSENGMTMNAVVSQINTEFAGELARIQRENPHDSCEITANRALWKEILAVYAVKTNTDPDNPLDVITLDDEKIDLLRTVFWDMNIIDYWIEEIEHPGDDEDEDTWYEYILHITVTGKTAAEMAEQYSFNAEQREMLDELLKPEYDDLWASLLAGIPSGGGADIITLGIYIWPSNDSNYITSFFGTRVHPITGEVHHHTGIDIGAAYGTEVLAAADGTVTLAGWNGEYGYCVIIDHGDGNKTLYAHMSLLDVSAGQTVTQGQTVGFVGSTGTSTGPHLHFETFVNGSRVDPLLYFDNYAAAW